MRAFRNLGLLAGMIGTAAISIDPTFPTPTVSVKRPQPMVRGRHRNRTTYFPAGLNGKKAVARRLRQIQAGSLKAENGLVARKHYFTPSGEDHDMCARCGLIFRNLTVHCINDEWPETDAQYIARLEAALEAPAAGDGEPVATNAQPFGYYFWTGNGDGTESPDFCEGSIPSWKRGVRNVTPLFTAPPADAGMREALGAELSEIFERFLSAHEGDKAHLADVLREWLWDNKAGLVAALTAPGATTKSDGGALSSLPAGESEPVVMQASPPSDPSSTRSEVTVGELARSLRHLGKTSPSYEAEARALLDQFKIRRK